MKFNRLTLTALFVLTPVLSQAVDVEAIRSQILSTVSSLEGKVLPNIKALAQAIKNKNTSIIEDYISNPNTPVIPQQALKLTSDNIESIQQALNEIFAVNIPADVVTFLNSLQSNLGTQAVNLKALAANTLKRINLPEQFATLASAAGKITTGDVKTVAQDLVNRFLEAKINPDKLIASAQSLAGTVGSLKTAALALKDQGVLDTLNQLSQDIPQFVQAKQQGNDDALGDLSDTILGLAAQLNDQGKTVKPFINAFGDFISQLVPFIDQLYTNLGPVVWAQVPADQQATIKEALKQLKDNEGTIINVIKEVKDKLNKVISEN